MYEGLAASYARRLPSVALLRRGAAEENSEQKKRTRRARFFVGVVLNISANCFNSLKQFARNYFSKKQLVYAMVFLP